MYTELEQFLGRGEEKAVWLLSIKNIGGLIGGGVLGHRLGSLVFGDGLGVLLCTLLGALAGLILTFQQHGLLILRRLVIRVQFYLRRAVRARTLDADAIFPVNVPREIPIQVFQYDGTPVIVPQIERTR
ncbi:MAG TPA: hypothetical protein VFZ66_19060 [Herpetosiphonaceae bacterium]